MSSFFAESVGLPDDIALDYGEGELVFQWPDSTYGSEGVSIDLDGHCSRAMPIRSGQGPSSFVEVRRDRIRLRFAPGLARQLELDEEVEIVFVLSDADFLRLRSVVGYFQSIEPEGVAK